MHMDVLMDRNAEASSGEFTVLLPLESHHELLTQATGVELVVGY